jgi:hypothetical protein
VITTFLFTLSGFESTPVMDYVKIDAGAFKDMAGNDYAGISDINTWNFSIRTLVTTYCRY